MLDMAAPCMAAVLCLTLVDSLILMVVVVFAAVAVAQSVVAAAAEVFFLSLTDNGSGLFVFWS